MESPGPRPRAPDQPGHQGRLAACGRAWAGGPGGRDRRHGGLRRRRDHDLRLRRHLHRRRGADRGVPARLPPRARAGGVHDRVSVSIPSTSPTSPGCADLTPRRRRPRDRDVARPPGAGAAAPRAVPLVGLRRRPAGGGCGLASPTFRREGKIAHLGGTNFDTAQMARLLAGGGAAGLHAGAVLADRPQARAGDGGSGAGGGGRASLLRFGRGRAPVGALAGPARARGAVRERAASPSTPSSWASSADWALFQDLLAALDRIARRHGSDVASVAGRLVLDQPRGRGDHRGRARPCASGRQRGHPRSGAHAPGPRRGGRRPRPCPRRAGRRLRAGAGPRAGRTGG